MAVEENGPAEEVEARISEDAAVGPAAEQRTFVELPDGGALTEEAASRVARRAGAEVVLFAGVIGSGKTTLLASAYQKFLEGPFGGCAFAGSETLRGFEDRCYRARIASGARSPLTPRTEQAAGIQMLHLRVRDSGPKERTVNLLFADMAGEFYRRARDSAEECRRLEILKRTDHLALLVNGQLLADVAQRQLPIRDARMLFRRFLECEMIGRRTAVQFIVTKWDLILSSGQADPVGALLVDFEHEMVDDYAKRIESLLFFRVAASPVAKPELGVGYGVEPVFRHWLSETPWTVTVGDQSEIRSLAYAREADRFRSGCELRH